MEASHSILLLFRNQKSRICSSCVVRFVGRNLFGSACTAREHHQPACRTAAPSAERCPEPFLGLICKQLVGSHAGNNMTYQRCCVQKNLRQRATTRCSRFSCPNRPKNLRQRGRSNTGSDFLGLVLNLYPRINLGQDCLGLLSGAFCLPKLSIAAA